MKVRILGNTIRLRVKMHEADKLRVQGMIEEVLEFGAHAEQQIRFRVSRGTDHFAIAQQEMSVSIMIPAEIVDQWATTEQVGIEETITTSHDRYIKVLIEKDFACLDGNRDEEEGSYPNPIEECKK